KRSKQLWKQGHLMTQLTIRSRVRPLSDSFCRGWFSQLLLAHRCPLDRFPVQIHSSTSSSAGGLMGRGRGKGKKLLSVSKHEDPGSGGEDSIPAYRRRGRPLAQKGTKDDVDGDEEEMENMIAEGEEDLKPAKEHKGTENGKKRKRHVSQSTDSHTTELVADKNGISARSVVDEPTKPNALARNGSRRKSKPRRAAEAGVE
ncbi:hypothetical protein KI387_013271, partial [Taxus chinensis]